MQRKHIGILTSGNDCPGRNAMICGATRATDPLDWEVVALILSRSANAAARAAHKEAERIEQAVCFVIRRQEATIADLDGGGTTTDFTNTVIEALPKPAKESSLPSLVASGLRI